MGDETNPENAKIIQMIQQTMDAIVDRLNEVANEFAAEGTQDHAVASILINSLVYSMSAVTKEILTRVGAKMGQEESEEFRIQFIREMMGAFDRLVREKATQHGKEIHTGFGAYEGPPHEPG